ncbi:MAG: tetratricopeptide repeat protein [Bacteroidia bacterium]
MSEERDHIWWIENYLDQTLTVTEKSEFETRLANEPELREKLDLHRSSIIAMKVALRMKEKEALKEMFQEVKNTTPVRTFQMRTWYYAAAAVVALLFATWLFLPNRLSPESIAQEYQEIYPFNYQRGDSPAEDSVFKLAGDFYTQGKFEEVIPLMQEMIASQPENQRYRLYLAMAYRETGQLDKAITELESISSHPTYGENATWFLALIHFKRGDETKAIDLFKEIAGSEVHYRKVQAQEILEKLGR